MDIVLSVNNRADILTIPVIPPFFTVTKPQGNHVFETVSKGELQLIGTPKLKGISWETFFPVRDYSFLKDRSMWGWDYIYKLDTWIAEKLPIRLVITDTPINMAVAVKNFEYTIKSDGDLWYKLEFEEFPLLEETVDTTDDEEIDMEELEKLKQEVKNLRELVDELANPFIYNYVDDNMPSWAREPVRAAVRRGCVDGEDLEGNLGFDYKDLRHITILHRAGVFEFIYNYVDDNMPDWAKEYVQKAINKGYLSGMDRDENGNAQYNLTTQDLRLITIMGRAGLLD